MALDFTTLPHGAKILNVTPVGDGGVVLNENFAMLDDLRGDYDAHAASSDVHGATSADIANRLVLRDASGDFSARNVTLQTLSVASITGLTSLPPNISVQKVYASENGQQVAARKEINFVEGDNVTLNISDDVENDRVNVTINSTGTGEGGGGSTNLDGLTDVVLSALAANDVLSYNGTQWVNRSNPTFADTFNASSDWGTASGGYYTQSFTHDLGTYDLLVTVWDETTSKFYALPDRIELTSQNVCSIRVPSSPDCRFAGRIIITVGGAGGGGGNVPTTNDYELIPVTIDGGGVVPDVGSCGFREIAYNCDVVGWTILADAAGDVVIDVRKGTYDDYPTTTSIAGAGKPTLSSAQKNQDTTVSDWTPAISAGEILEFVIESISAVTRLQLFLRVRRT